MTLDISSQMSVELVAKLASDLDVIRAMRVSTVGQNDPEDSDPEAVAGRIKFLMKNRHGTPFEHNTFSFFVSAPIFVFREFHRHRIGFSYNEESGRYKQLDAKFYIPAADRPIVQQGKPGAYEFVPGTKEQYAEMVDALTRGYLYSYAQYQKMLEMGVAKEVARMCLPVGIYSSMYVTCNARSLMSFLGLRTDDERAAYPSKPMKEIEFVARRMELIFAEAMPLTYAAFNEFGRVSP